MLKKITKQLNVISNQVKVNYLGFRKRNKLQRLMGRGTHVARVNLAGFRFRVFNSVVTTINVTAIYQIMTYSVQLVLD